MPAGAKLDPVCPQHSMLQQGCTSPSRAPGSYLRRRTLTLTGSLPEVLRYASTACKQPARLCHVDEDEFEEEEEEEDGE